LLVQTGRPPRKLAAGKARLDTLIKAGDRAIDLRWRRGTLAYRDNQ